MLTRLAPLLCLLLAGSAAAEPYNVLDVPPPPEADEQPEPPKAATNPLPPLPEDDAPALSEAEDEPEAPAEPPVESAEKPLSAATLPKQIPVRRRMYVYFAPWCGPCVPERATIEQFCRDNKLTLGVYTGPPKPGDADVLLVDVDKFPSKAGINSIPAIRVVEATEVGRLVGLATVEQIGELWNRGRVQAVRMQVGTLPVKQYVDKLLATLGKGIVEVAPGVIVNLAGNVSIGVLRSQDAVAVTFSPAPAIRLTKFGLRYDATLNGLSVTADKIVLKLGGMPDLTFGVE